MRRNSLQKHEFLGDFQDDYIWNFFTSLIRNTVENITGTFGSYLHMCERCNQQEATIAYIRDGLSEVMYKAKYLTT